MKTFEITFWCTHVEEHSRHKEWVLPNSPFSSFHDKARSGIIVSEQNRIENITEQDKNTTQALNLINETHSKKSLVS